MVKHCKISLIIFVLLVFTAFVPVIQVVLMTINGGFLSLFIKGNSNTPIYISNSIGALLFLSFYFYSDLSIFKVLNASAFLFFFFPLVSYATDGIIPKDPYFLSLCLIGALSGTILLLVDILKFKLKN